MRALSFSNLISVLALFIALGGTAVAVGVGRNSIGSPQVKDGSIRSGDIGNRQVNAVDLDPSLGFHCPARTRYMGGSCIELGLRAETSQRVAEERCFQNERRLPTVAELQLLRFVPEFPVTSRGEWTSAYISYREPEALWGVLVFPAEPYTSVAPRFTASFPFRCVALARD